MTGRSVERKLAAVLAMDVAGYSRLMEIDETGTLANLKAILTTVIGPIVAAYRGRIVNTAGDGLLVEFPSANSAAECAIAMLEAIAGHNTKRAAGPRLEYRLGLNIDDVMVDGETIYGDGVNIAARLEQMADPGSLLVSAALIGQIGGELRKRFIEVGERSVKNVSSPIHVYRLADDARLQATWPPRDEAARHIADAHPQKIQFCEAHDGTMIAYATVGAGPPLVKAAHWLSHLEFDRTSPIWRHIFEELAGEHRLVRYDERGTGLSDWNVDDLSFEAMVQDLETVVDAVGLDRFALFAMSQDCAVAIAYAARHPDRVSQMVFHGGYAQGWLSRGDPEEITRRKAMMALTEAGWTTEHMAFRQVFTSLFIPGGSAEQLSWWNDLQRVSTSPKNAVRLQQAMSQIDVRALLSHVKASTLVMHSSGDAVVPLEAGRRLAAGIPHARFVVLDSRNHIILEQEAAWTRFVSEVRAFLRPEKSV